MAANVSQMHSDHIYSQDPLMASPSVNGHEQHNEEVIYESILPTDDEQKKPDFYANMYTIPKENLV